MLHSCCSVRSYLFAVFAVLLLPVSLGPFVQPVAAQERAVAIPAPVRDLPETGRIARAVFAGGCFWGVQGVFQHVDGVTRAVSGYSGGSATTATYELTSTGTTGHAEAVLVAFDPTKIAYARLLEVFFEEHDPTQGMRQGNDVGTQYRSGIYFANDAQKATAEMARDAYDEQLKAAGKDPITTEIEPAGHFYYAEDYHQQYLHKVPNGYCGLAGTGVSCRIPAAAS